jgi:hypothetical protein
MKNSVFWDTKPYSPLKVNRRFGETCRLYLQGRRISQARNQREAYKKRLSVSGWFLGLFFDPENGGANFL